MSTKKNEKKNVNKKGFIYWLSICIGGILLLALLAVGLFMLTEPYNEMETAMATHVSAESVTTSSPTPTFVPEITLVYKTTVACGVFQKDPEYPVVYSKKMPKYPTIGGMTKVTFAKNDTYVPSFWSVSVMVKKDVEPYVTPCGVNVEKGDYIFDLEGP